MTSNKSKEWAESSESISAEAAVWVARLHSPTRSAEVEAGLRCWLAGNPQRAVAFEQITDAWERSARLRGRPTVASANYERRGLEITFPRALLATLVVMGLAVWGTLFHLHGNVVATGIGERRTVVLEDGTRVSLNTDTRAVIHYERRQRRIDLERGEALFEVAPRPDWPLIVTAGEREIRALGTAFVVRRDEQNLAVTLMEGKVIVSPLEPELPTDVPSAVAETAGKEPRTVALSPGQRLTLVPSKAPQLDRPSLIALTAWQRGQIALDNTPLPDAVAEMNRYSAVHIRLEDAAAASIRVSGIFRVGDSADFAQALAKTYGLQARIGSRGITLTGTRSIAQRKSPSVK
jgi:transmembrane sensor